MKKIYFLHPLFFGLFPLLAFYNENIEKILFYRLYVPIGLSLGFVVGLWLFFQGSFRARNKSSLLVTFLVFMFFSYGHIFNIIWWIFFRETENESNLISYPVWLLFILLISFLIYRTKKNLENITKVLFIIGITLLAVSFFQIASHKIQFMIFQNSLDFFRSEPVLRQDKNSLSSENPDIYYIILDGYADTQVLKELYGYDNTEFLNHLRSKNFKVVSNTFSNYSLTFLSLGSSLNMKYINYVSDVVGSDSTSRVIMSEVIKNNQVLQQLKARGYKTVHFSSGWGATNRNQFADQNIYCARNNEFTTVLFLTTMLRPFENMFLSQSIRERVLCTFSRLATIKDETNGPLFVFAHIVSPHPPYVFGAQGEAVEYPSVPEKESWHNKDGYLNQLKFITRQTEELVNKLTSDKENRPVIIIQSDHGSASTPGMEEYNPDLINERMRPLIAYNFPGKEVKADKLTPVNIFRILFNEYFGEKYNLLDNEMYFSTYGKPYKFMNVTAFLKPDFLDSTDSSKIKAED